MSGLTGYVYHRTYKKKSNDPGLWPVKKKMEAVVTWLAIGNLTSTAGIIGVGLPTVKKWKQSPWWKEAVDQFQADDKQELDAKYQKIIRKALTVTEDRLDNGNFQMDQKTGRIVRVPVSMNDSHRLTKDLVDQQITLRKNIAVEVVQAETINDKLIKLASQFAEMAMGKKPKEIEPFEGEIIGQDTYEADTVIRADEETEELPFEESNIPSAEGEATEQRKEVA